MSKRTKMILIPVALVALGVGWWLGSPLFLDSTVDEAFPEPAAVEVETATTSQGTVPAAGEDPSDAVVTTEPVLLASGVLAGADDFHEGTGTASIYELEDGAILLRLTEFEVTNGPDLRVTLFDGSEYLDLGALKGNIGDQNYEIPTGTDLASYSTVVIWCRAFDVVFASAGI